jgi:hypothetical protein
LHPYWITIGGHLGVGVTARSEGDALQLVALAFPSQKAVSIEIIKDMNDLDQNHVLPNLGGANWLSAWHLVSPRLRAHCKLRQCAPLRHT